MASPPLLLARLVVASLVVVNASACAARTAHMENPAKAIERDRPDISVTASYIGEAAANPRGGLRQDATFVGRVLLAADLWLDRKRGARGPKVSAMITNRHGDDLGNVAIGSGTGVQQIYSPQASHLPLLTYQHPFMDGRLEIEGGRTAANLYFLTSTLCNYLQTNASCGSPTFAFKASNLTYFPASSWGAHAKLHLTGQTFAHAGVFEVNPDRKRPDATGLEWGLENATGTVVPFLVGHVRTNGKGQRRGRYELGGWYDASPYEDPLVDDQGAMAIVSGRSPMTRRGRSGAFVSIEQVMWRSEREPERSVTVFGRALRRVSGRTIQDQYLEFGLVHAGAFRQRSRDSIAFVFTDQQFSDLALRRVRAADDMTGRADRMARHQFMLELAYGVSLPGRLRVSPNLQLIINPDRLSDPFRITDAQNVVVAGLKFSYSIPLASRSGDPASDSPHTR